jgi:hypothetical protein
MSQVRFDIEIDLWKLQNQQAIQPSLKILDLH